MSGTYTLTVTKDGCTSDPATTNVTVVGTGSISGDVFLQGRCDHSGATISLDDLPVTTTGSDGSFTILDVTTGTHRVKASMDGYLDAERSGVVVTACMTTTLPTVTIIGGDADGNNFVNIFDLAIVGTAYGTSPPSDPQADINGDNKVNIFDLVLVGGNFGRSGPTEWPGCLSAAPLSAPAAKMLVSPFLQAMDLGATTTVDIRIEDVAGLYGAEVCLTFDPTRLEVQDLDPLTPGVQIRPGTLFDLVQCYVVPTSGADNNIGEIRYALTLRNPASPISGSGVLATVTFKAIGEGSSPLTFDTALLLDQGANQIEATAQGGSIVVGELYRLYLPIIAKD